MSRETVWVLRWTEDADEICLSQEKAPIAIDSGDFWMQHERLPELRRLWSTFAARVYCNRDLHADLFDAPPASGAKLVGGDYGSATTTLVSKSASEPGKWQATRFDWTGEPFGHTVYDSLHRAVTSEKKWGARFVTWLGENGEEL